MKISQSEDQEHKNHKRVEKMIPDYRAERVKRGMKNSFGREGREKASRKRFGPGS